ncbi:MAG: radical SAM protein [Bacteroidota bacterium]|nr:radical SAM protein [Bacteroidota bacterium]
MKLKDAVSNFVRDHRTLYSIGRKFQGVQFQWTYHRFYKTFSPDHKSSIREIHIEPVNYCNLRCSFCALDHEKMKVRITPEVIRAFFDQWMKDVRFDGLQWIHLHNGGEALLHPKMDQILEVFQEYKQKCRKIGKRFPKVSLLTNATVLKPEKAELLIDSGIFNLFRFSVDGGNPEAFEEFRKRAKWESVGSNIEWFLVRNNRSERTAETGIICLVPNDRPLRSDWMSEDFRQLLAKVDSVEYRHAHGWAGELETEQEIAYLPEKQGCNLLVNSMVILPDGQVTVCCADLNQRGVVGNILKEDLFDLYASPLRLGMIDRLAKGQKDQIPLCQDCETF